MTTTWILIANSSTASLYEIQKAKFFNSNGNADENLKLIKTFSHQESRKMDRELVSDRSGRYHVEHGHYDLGHGSYMETTDPKEYEADRFARELISELESGRIEDLFDELVIVSSPPFQGVISKHLNVSLEKLLSRRINKDYTRLKNRELAQQLQEQL